MDRAGIAPLEGDHVTSELGQTFSQRNGLSPVPPQLSLGVLSADLRNRLHYAFDSSFAESIGYGTMSAYLDDPWKRILTDTHVKFLRKNVSQFSGDVSRQSDFLQQICMGADLGVLFDYIEFVLRHPLCPDGLVSEITDALVQGRSAYRILDGRTISAVGTALEAETISTAVRAAEGPAPGAARHLLDASSDLRRGDWSGSIRNSIHAVESIAVKLASPKDTLNDALAVLATKGHLHGGLKAAFGKLYGYSSDEEGVRHALVFQDSSAADETDALFMLGACAAFVSYLLTRGQAGGLIQA